MIIITDDNTGKTMPLQIVYTNGLTLIADSGSTKTDWRFFNYEGYITALSSDGINPYYEDETQIANKLELTFGNINHEVGEIFFYGAGCAGEESIAKMKRALNTQFPNAHCEVYSDLLGSARALCGNEAGIACILGTGSNSCFYDGEKIAENIPPLGFMLGDEGSGAVLGRKIVVAYLRKYMPDDLLSKFEIQYALTKEQVLENVYNQSFPNRYLAQFTKFLSENIEHPFVAELLMEHFTEFFDRHIKHYSQWQTSNVHFVGSLAFYFEAFLKQAAENLGIQIGKIITAPIDGLIYYHSKNY